MNGIAEILLNNGVLIAIAYVFFDYLKEDRAESREDRKRNADLTEKFVKVSETQIAVSQKNNEVIKENTKVSKEVINVSERMIDSLGYSENSHENIETDLKLIKEDLIALKDQDCTSEMIPILERIENKIDQLGKQSDVERGNVND